MGKNIVILGAGFGGLACANMIRKTLGKEHRVIVIDPAIAGGLPWCQAGGGCCARAAELDNVRTDRHKPAGRRNV